MAQSDGKLIFDTKVDSKGFEQGVNKLKSVGQKSLGLVAKSVTAVSTALMAMGTYSIKESIKFESAFAGVRKVLDATESEFASLEKGIRNMSKELPQSASEIAGVAESAGQLGIAKEDILSFTKTMVMLGDATDLTSEQASTSLARLSAITGMSAKDYDRLGSSIVALGNNFATTESEVVEIGLRLAGTGNQIGLAEHQMLGFAGAMSAVGINAEAGGSALSRVLQKMNTEVLSSGDNLQGFADIAGKSAEDFSKQWKEAPAEAITEFVEGLGRVKASGGDVTTELKKLGISSIQEIDTLLRLSGASDQLVSALDISAKGWAENTALVDEANQRYETTESKLKILKNNANDLAITMGDKLSGSFNQVIDGLGGYIDKINEVISPTKATAEQLELLGMEAHDLGLKMGEVPVSFERLGVVVGEIVADMLTKLVESTPKMLDTATALMSALLLGIQNALPDIVQAGLGIVNSFVNAIILLLPQILSLGLTLLTEFISGLASGLPQLITQAIDLVIGLADTFIDNVPSLIDAGLELLLGLVKGIMDNLPKLIEEVPRLINSFTGAIMAKLPDILLTGMKILIEIGLGLIKAIPTLIANIPQIILAIINAFMLINWAQTGMNVLKGIGKGIKNFGPTVVSWAKGVGTSILNGIKSIFTGGASGIGKDLVKGIWNGISNVQGWIMGKIGGWTSSVLKGIKGFFGIKSPSKKTQVFGVELIRGMGVGVEEQAPKLQKDIDKEMSKLSAGMKSTVEAETKGKVEILTSNSSVSDKVRQGYNNFKDNLNEVVNGGGEIVISGNTFEIREEKDIEKVAKELQRLMNIKERGRI